MPTDINDPKLTAYVLGELSDTDRKALEHELTANPNLRAEIDALRDLTARLQAELAAEPAPELSTVRISPRSNSKPALCRLAIAASLLAALGVASYVAPRMAFQNGHLTLARESTPAALPSPFWYSDDSKYLPTGPDMKPDRADALAKDGDSLDRLPAVTAPTPVIAPAKGRSEAKLATPELSIAASTSSTERDDPYADQAGQAVNAVPAKEEGEPKVYRGKGEGGQQQPLDRLSESTRKAEGLYSPASGPIATSANDLQNVRDTLKATREEWSGPVDDAYRAQRAKAVLEYEEAIKRADSDLNSKYAKKASEVSRHAWDKVQTAAEIPGAESYAPIAEQAFIAIRDKQTALSTFSIDVDTASYSNVRRFLENGQLPPADAVRVEELVNYFKYDYPQPDGDVPFSVNLEVAACPWQPEHRLVRVGLKGREIPRDKRPASNFVFLLDVSGSMQPENKLPLVKQSMKLLVEQLTENDRVAIVTYAGEAGLKLASTTAAEKQKIIAAIDSLQAGGSTNGEGGLKMAYDVAVGSKIAGGTNRVILATDGDFNVGLSSDADMEALITKEAGSGVFLTVIGVGMGDLKDSKLERLADKGNGNYAYIDKPSEAHKVFVEQLAGTLVTIAKDVKIQVEFNPATVRAHRLIGYDNRRLAHKDFNDDTKDAGEIGAGHSVTALYEIVPAVAPQIAAAAAPGVERLRYQVEEPPVPLTDAAKSGELMVVKLRYKQPDGAESKLIETAVKDSGRRFYEATSDFKFAAAVATFGLRLRESQFRGSASFALALELAQSAVTRDESGHRRELVDLTTRAKQLTGER
jgi:Ca-activated chloride channel family protein